MGGYSTNRGIGATQVSSDSGEKMAVGIRQATKKGYIEISVPGVCDVSYPESKLRRGRVQGGGNVSPTITTTGGICKILKIEESK